jgi:hypothetical protein
LLFIGQKWRSRRTDRNVGNPEVEEDLRVVGRNLAGDLHRCEFIERGRASDGQRESEARGWAKREGKGRTSEREDHVGDGRVVPA